jgi:aryl-alcohol dehydrogenase (NADP+)
MYAWQFMNMLAVSRANGWAPFVSMQPQYNLVYREEEREMLPLCLNQGVGVIPWSPLARGFLAGGRAAPGEGNTERARSDEFAPRLYYREADHAVVEAVSAIAKARGVPNMQVALAWVLRNRAITAPIIGASKAHHIADAVAGLALKLTDDEAKALEAPYQPKPVLDHG